MFQTTALQTQYKTLQSQYGIIDFPGVSVTAVDKVGRDKV